MFPARVGMSGPRPEDGILDIGDTVYFSTDTVSFNALHQVEYVLEADVEARKTRVSFYDGSKNIGSCEHPILYLGTGHMHLGSVNPESKHDMSNYEGEMLEFRLWNRALSVGEMNEYRQKRLTGFELGLLDNFPLNEGQGNYSYNTVGSGGDLNVMSAEWNVPDGISMTLDGKQGFRIEPQFFSRKDYHDYTMTFGACRAYFQLKGLEVKPSDPTETGINIVMDFDGTETAIQTVESDIRDRKDNTAQVWYSLDGRRLGGKPSAKGVYILAGRKVVIR